MWRRPRGTPRRSGTRPASTRSGESARARSRRALLAALAQEALKFPGEHVAGGHVLLGRAGVVGRRLLEALDEGLHLGVGLNRGLDLALVLGRGALEVGCVDGDAKKKHTEYD